MQPFPRRSLALLVTGTLALASCGQQITPAAQVSLSGDEHPQLSTPSQILELARQPELQDDPVVQRILLDNANDPALLARLNGQNPAAATIAADQLQAQGLNGKALYTFGVATGSVSHYWQERKSPNYPGLNWNYDGCSIPEWILNRSATAREYKNKFHEPCLVHDFGYRNASVISSNWAVGQGYRLLVDQAFGRNMDRVCAGIGNYFSRVKCYSVSYAFEKAVTLGGFDKLNT